MESKKFPGQTYTQPHTPTYLCTHMDVKRERREEERAKRKRHSKVWKSTVIKLYLGRHS